MKGIESGGGTGKPQKKARIPKVKKPTPVKPPAGDVASSGGDYGMKEANRAKRTDKTVQRNTAAVYTQQAPKQKRAILDNATGDTAKTVQRVHAHRVARNRQLAASQATKDTKGDTDRQRAAAYL